MKLQNMETKVILEPPQDGVAQMLLRSGRYTVWKEPKAKEKGQKTEEG